MQITEIEWIKANKDKLDEEDMEALSSFNFFEQIEEGELNLTLPKMLELMTLITYIHQKHIKTTIRGILK